VRAGAIIGQAGKDFGIAFTTFSAINISGFPNATGHGLIPAQQNFRSAVDFKHI